MKKIMLSLIALAGCMSMNAQTIRVYENGTLLDTYVNSDNKNYKVVFEEAPEESQEAEEHEYVDLGLSVKWATMNVGATEVAGSKINSHTGQLDCYGEYYAWGETSPKDSYDESNLKYCNSYDEDNWEFNFSKYVASGDYGTVDNKDTLELADDAASVNWGGSWRMPTDAEQQELRDNCYWEWTKSYNNSGVLGYIVYKVKNDSDKGVKKYSGGSATTSASYSLSDTHIFLPAAGYCSGSDYYDGGYEGEYWSSSLFTESSNFASDLLFYPDSVLSWGGINHRYVGQSVRPVCP